MTTASEPSPEPEPSPEGRLPRVGFLGPAGTFSEEALLAGAPAGAAEPVPLASIYDAVVALRDGAVDLSVVPIENSLDGSIDVTLDLLAEQAPGLQIVAETLLRVRHSLIAVRDVPLEDIAVVVSHPKVPGQCSHFLRAELPRAEIRSAASTAEAVRAVVAAGDPTMAALGTALAADIYGATVVREGVEDRADNATRFVWLARAEDGRRPALLGGAGPAGASAGAGRRCSIVFWGPGAERPGWLVRCLSEFASRDINLTKIESRPRREELGSYMFFADLAGGAEEPAVAAALEGLKGICEEVRVLGSYPAAAPAA